MTNKQPLVLVVDDHQGWCEAIESILEEANCIVEFAKTYNTATAKIQERKYDLVILDIRLREEAEYDVQGIDILEKISRQNKELPVIVLTGHATKALKQKVEEWYGAFAFLEKVSDETSLDREHFMQTVRRALAKTGNP